MYMVTDEGKRRSWCIFDTAIAEDMVHCPIQRWLVRALPSNLLAINEESGRWLDSRLR